MYFVKIRSCDVASSWQCHYYKKSTILAFTAKWFYPKVNTWFGIFIINQKLLECKIQIKICFPCINSMEAKVQKCKVYIWQCQYLCNHWFGLVRASKWCKAQRKLQMLHSCNKSLILSWTQYSAFNTKHSLKCFIDLYSKVLKKCLFSPSHVGAIVHICNVFTYCLFFYLRNDNIKVI